MRLGLGIAAGPDPDRLVVLAREAEDLGFDSIWCNDSPAGDGLAQLWAWAGASHHIRLGVGVLALDRHDPATIAARLLELELPLDRLMVGLGAGFSGNPVRIVRTGAEVLRRRVPGVRLAVAAMGPRMCRLGGEIGDGVLLNWMTPERAEWARAHVEEGVAAAGRDPAAVSVYGYVRAALGRDATERLVHEGEMYLPQPHYGRHFQAMGAAPVETGIATEDPAALAARLKAYAAMDEPIVRVLSHRDPADILAVARAAIGA